MKNELQYKLSNYEAAPPTHVWDEIETALAHQATLHATLLFKFEQAPPAELWNKIEQQLEEKDEKIITLTKRTNFIRYAAAAAMLVLVASAITFFIIRGKQGNELANTPSPVKKGTTNTSTVEKKNADGKPSDYTVDNNKEQTNYSKPDTELNKDKSSSSRYMTIADEEGKKIRLSKKVASVFNCADNIASIKGIRCKEDIETLQQKMSASMLSASGDFSGLMDMIKSLEENN